MPERIVWPLSGSVETRRVGSSATRRWRAVPIFSWSALELGSIDIEMTGSGKDGGSRRMSKSSSQSVSPVMTSLTPDQGADVARVGDVDLLALDRAHQHQARDALAAAGARVVERHAPLDRAGVDAEEDELADKGVGPELEGEAGELALVVDHRRDLLAVAVLALHRGHVDRARQVVDDAVEQALDALLLEGRAGHDAAEIERDRRLADREDELVDRDLLAAQELVRDDVVEIGHRLDQLLAVLAWPPRACRPGSATSPGSGPAGRPSPAGRCRPPSGPGRSGP